ncbi:MAG: M48 family metalloprotease, partial [Kiritimatiellae bacterium]|nr:M48 family metalloprotease [Kiritimatiellia bacterium]
GLIAEVGAAIAEHQDESDLAMAIRALSVVGAIFYVPIHSRKNEFEADRVGLFYMAKAGYDPRAMPRIWKRVAEKQKEEQHSASIFATHPSCWDRYEALEKMIPHAMEEYKLATGSYPPDYTPPAELADGLPPFDWRNPAPKK